MLCLAWQVPSDHKRKRQKENRKDVMSKCLDIQHFVPVIILLKER